MTDVQGGQLESAAAEEISASLPEIDPATLNEDQQEALTFLAEVCAASGMDIHPVARGLHTPYFEVELMGSDVAGTFGRLGQSLDALQFLCNLILSHRVRSDVRLLLDGGGYRARRAENLRRRAVELANEVKARNEEAELEPLPAHERRIIHTILKDDPDISTYSEGDEPDRRVVISPRR